MVAYGTENWEAKNQAYVRQLEAMWNDAKLRGISALPYYRKAPYIILKTGEAKELFAKFQDPPEADHFENSGNRFFPVQSSPVRGAGGGSNATSSLSLSSPARVGPSTGPIATSSLSLSSPARVGPSAGPISTSSMPLSSPARGGPSAGSNATSSLSFSSLSRSTPHASFASQRQRLLLEIKRLQTKHEATLTVVAHLCNVFAGQTLYPPLLQEILGAAWSETAELRSIHQSFFQNSMWQSASDRSIAFVGSRRGLDRCMV